MNRAYTTLSLFVKQCKELKNHANDPYPYMLTQPNSSLAY